MRLRTACTAVASLLLAGSLTHAQSDALQKAPAGNLYVMAEHRSISKDKLQEIADIIKGNFDAAGIGFSAAASDTFPSLSTLDALVIYLDTELAPRDFGNRKDDCPLSGHNVGESDALVKASYESMKQRLGFEYDEETVRGCVTYICPGRSILAYRLHRMLAGKQDNTLTLQHVDQLLASIATHEVAHTLGGVHVFRAGDPQYLPADGYFLGSMLTYADSSTRFHERNITKMREFVNSAREEKADMRSLNKRKSLILHDIILQRQ